MAISLAYPFIDVPNLQESIKFHSFAYNFDMESGVLADEPTRLNYGGTIQISSENNSSTTATNNNNNNNSNNNTSNNFQTFDQVIDFVDSPPDSKESWPSEYQKIMHGPIVLENPSNNQTVISNRKRRMDWDTIDVPQKTQANNETKNNPNYGIKEKDRKKGSQGRLGWADDIDLDLSSELSNNGYISEALLAFNSHLTVFKQEIPSPTHENQQKNGQIQHGQPQQRQVITENREVQNIEKSGSNSSGNNINNTITVSNNTSNNNNNNKNNNNNNNQNSSSGGNNENTGAVQPGNNSNTNGGGIIENSGNVQNINSLHQMLQHQNSFDPQQSSPNQNEIAVYKKSETDECRFQYVLAAPTSIATKSNEETLTYLNQGQSYEIKLKKIGDLSSFRGKILKSIVKICFHERRLQYMEKEQIQQWLASRPGERIIEVDVPLSYGLCHVSQSMNVNLVNTVEVHWDPMKEVGVYIKLNCISTEFTPKKHGGEKGVPFRIQIETYYETTQTFEGILKPIHAAACQIKVFKLKGADRKHKQDREKIQKRPPSEQEKYQPSCECTILSDIPCESLVNPHCYSPELVRPTVSPMLPASPVNMAKFDSIIPYQNTTAQALGNLTTSNPNLCKIIDQNMLSPPQQAEIEDYIPLITKESTPTQIAQWMNHHRMTTHVGSFINYTGSDLLRMSKEDLIQICGLPDGIRLFNILHAKTITPRLTIYVTLDSNSFHALYLHIKTTKELSEKLYKIPGIFDVNSNNNSSNNGNSSSMNGNDNIFWGGELQSKYSGSGTNIYDATKLQIFMNGPSGIHVLVNDEVLSNVKDESLFLLEVLIGGKIIMKPIYKNEINLN